MLSEPRQIKNATVCRLCGSLFEDNNKIIVKCPACNSDMVTQVSCNYIAWVLQRNVDG